MIIARPNRLRQRATQTGSGPADPIGMFLGADEFRELAQQRGQVRRMLQALANNADLAEDFIWELLKTRLARELPAAIAVVRQAG